MKNFKKLDTKKLSSIKGGDKKKKNCDPKMEVVLVNLTVKDVRD